MSRLEKAVTYYRNLPDAERFFQPLGSADHCFECGKHISGAGVEYHGINADGVISALYFHPSCAAVMGQRLICDGYPRRRDG